MIYKKTLVSVSGYTSHGHLFINKDVRAIFNVYKDGQLMPFNITGDFPIGTEFVIETLCDRMLITFKVIASPDAFFVRFRDSNCSIFYLEGRFKYDKEEVPKNIKIERNK